MRNVGIFIQGKVWFETLAYKIQTPGNTQKKTYNIQNTEEVSNQETQNCKLSKEQSMLPEDDRMIETCRSVLSVLM